MARHSAVPLDHVIIILIIYFLYFHLLINELVHIKWVLKNLPDLTHTLSRIRKHVLYFLFS